MGKIKRTSWLPLCVALFQTILYQVFTLAPTLLFHFRFHFSTLNLLFTGVYFILAYVFIWRVHMPIVLQRTETGKLALAVKFIVFALVITFFPLLTQAHHRSFDIVSFLNAYRLGAAAFVVALQYLSLYALKKIVDPSALETKEAKRAKGRPITYIILIFIAIITGLQFIPIVNLFIMMFGMALLGPYVWGFMPHLVTLGIVADTAAKRLPKAVLLLPLIVYSAYYIFYFNEYLSMKKIEAQLQAKNPAEVIAYDPEKMVVSMQGSQGLVSVMKMPVAYEPNSNFPEGYFAYRLVTPELCQKFRSLKTKWNDGFSPTRRSKGDRFGKRLKQCQIRRPEKPSKPVLNILTKNEKVDIEGLQVSKTAYEFSLEGKRLGTFETASIGRLPAFPFFMFGYAPKFPEASGGGPYAHFYGSQETLDVLPKSVDKEKYGSHPVSAMLEIETYKDSDFDNFKDYDENVSLIEKLLVNKETGQEDDPIKRDNARLLAEALNNKEISDLNKLFDNFKKGIRNNANAQEDIELLARAIQDDRINSFWFMWEPINSLGEESKKLAKPIVERILSTDMSLPRSYDTVKALGDAMRALPEGATAEIYPQLSEVAKNVKLRNAAWKAITRLNEGGKESLPIFMEIIQDYKDARLSSDYETSKTAGRMKGDAAIGAMIGLCKLGTDALPAKELILSTPISDSDLFIATLMEMGLEDELKQKFDQKQIERARHKKEQSKKHGRSFCGASQI